jgi:hypothetical protein
MAIPENIYNSAKVKFAKDSALKQHSLALRSYFSINDIQLKEKFKLDYKANFVLSGTTCFVGCVLSGSVNAGYHNPARFGARFEDLILLTDAGINSKPPAPFFQVQSGESTFINILDNAIVLRAVAEAAEFQDSDIYLNVADSENLNIYEEELFDTVEAGDSEIYSGLEIFFDVLYFRVGKTYVLTLKSENEEGTTSATLSLSPAPAAIILKYGSTLDVAISNVSGSTIYVNRKISNAVVSDNLIFYSNAAGTAHVAAGYYLSIIAEENGTYKYFRVTGSSGQVTEIGLIVSRHQDIYYYYSTVSAAEAISHSPSQIILYYEVLITPPGSDFENRRYYVGPFSDSAYATQGFYVKEDRTTVLYIGINGTASVLIS